MALNGIAFYIAILYGLPSSAAALKPAPSPVGTTPETATQPGRPGSPALEPLTQPDDHPVLVATRDHTRRVDEAGLYVLLDHAKQLAPTTAVDESVAVRRADLLRHPEDYRGRLVRVRAKYAETVSFMPSNRRRYGATAYSTLAWERGSLEAVEMISVADPGELRRGANVVLAGYFLKVRRDEARVQDANDGPRHVDVPVIVGPGVVVEPTEPMDLGGGLAWMAMLVGVILLAGFWIVVRRWARGQASRRTAGRARGEVPVESTAHHDEDTEPIDLAALQEAAQETRGATGAPAPQRDMPVCPSCGVSCRRAARFCDQCGAALKSGQGSNQGSSEAKE